MADQTIDAGLLSTWREAANRGRRWLAAQVDATPMFATRGADLNWYSKVPWALAGSGDRACALRVLRTAHRTFLKPALRTPRETHWTNAVSYALGWLVAGARASEAYDIARELYAELQKYQCPTTGGLFSALDATDWFDASIQGAALHASTAMNDLAAARRAGDFSLQFIEDQPRPNEAVFLQFHPAKGFRTDFSREDTLGRFVLWRGAPHQPLANLGFALQGLCRVTEATGEIKYARGAERLLDLLLQNHREDLLAHSQNHKVGYAAAILWRHTGRRDLLEVATTIAQRIADKFDAQGRSLADLFFSDIEKQPPYVSVRTTCDSVLWLSGICDELQAQVPVA